MTPLRFHHVGVGTLRFEEAITVYVGLGYTLVAVVDDGGLGVRVALLRASDGPLIEVVAPLGPDGPLAAHLARRVLPSPFHTCYATPDLDESSAALRERGFLPLGEPRPALAFKGARIAHHVHPAIGLVALLELAAPVVPGPSDDSPAGPAARDPATSAIDAIVDDAVRAMKDAHAEPPDEP